MEWYFVFETENGGFAVCEADKERALAMASEISEFDGSCELIDEFPADEMGDDRVDAYGYDVY